MTSRRIHLLQMMLILVALGAPALAHHSPANYDLSKDVVVKGTVTQWIWRNPHCLLLFDAKDEDGTIRHWTAEVQSPTAMTPRGWTRKSLAIGDQVTVYLKPGREGVPTGLITRVVLPNGQTLLADPLNQGAKLARKPVPAK